MRKVKRSLFLSPIPSGPRRLGRTLLLEVEINQSPVRWQNAQGITHRVTRNSVSERNRAGKGKFIVSEEMRQ